MDSASDHRPQPLADATQSPALARPPLWVLILVTAISPFALQVVVPALPGLVHDFSTDYATIQLSLVVYLVGLAVAQLVYGPLSDRYGRRPVLLAGMAVFLAGSVLCVFAGNITILLVGRALQAAGGCSGIVLSRAIVRDLYERERAASMIAYIAVGMVAAPMVGPVIGGYIYQWFGWQALFAFVLGFGVVVTAAAMVLLHETHHRRSHATTPAELLAGFALLMRMRRFRGYAVQVAFTTGSFYSFLGGASYVAIDLMGRTPAQYAWWFMLVSGCYMTGNFISGRFTVQLGVDRMITAGTVLSMITSFVLVAVTFAGWLSLYSFFLLAGVMSIGNGFAMPNGFAGAVSVDPHRAGTASGLSGFLQMAIGAVLMSVVGHTLSDSALPVVAMMSTGAVCAWLAHLHGLRR